MAQDLGNNNSNSNIIHQIANLFVTFGEGLKSGIISKPITPAAASTPVQSQQNNRALTLSDVWYGVMSAAYEKYAAAYVNDIYTEDDGRMFAVLSQDGKLYRSEITLSEGQAALADWQQVVIDFKPVSAGEEMRAILAQGLKPGTHIIRQADGKVRWVSVSCTAILNRVGEIDSTALFDSFIKHANETGLYPYRTFYHQGETFRTGQADYLAREGVCYITSGVYDESDIARAEIASRESNPSYWGESIGYEATSEPQRLAVADGISIQVFTQGIHKEISTVRSTHAAALYTTTSQIVREAFMNDKVFKELVTLFGDEEKARKWAEANVDETNRSALSLVTRAKMLLAGSATSESPDPDATTTTTQAQAAGETEAEAEGDFILDATAIEAISRHILASPEMQVLTTTLNEIKATLDAVSKTSSENSQRLTRSVSSIDTRLKVVERVEESGQREHLNDMPAHQQSTDGLYRARVARANNGVPRRVTVRAPASTPEAETESSPDFSSIAEQTLSQMN